MSDFPLPRTGLPGLAPLVAGDLWSRWSGEGRVFPLAAFRDAVRYLRLKPGTSCRLAAFSSDRVTASGIPVGVRVHLFADADRAAMAFAKVRADRRQDPAEPAAFMDAEHAVVVVPFLDDPELPALCNVRRPFRIKQWLVRALGYSARGSKRAISLHLLRYKPGRRAVWRVDLEGRSAFHLRVERPRVAAGHVRLAEAIRVAAGETNGWTVPRLRLFDAERGVVLRDWVEGVIWGEMADAAGRESAAESVGSALASLHGLEVDAESPDGTLPAACSQVEDLLALLPEAETRLRAAAEAIDGRLGALRALDDESVLIHGDLHPGQVVFCNDKVVWLDLERARRGSCAFDLATCRAHDSTCIGNHSRRRALEVSYRSAARGAPDDTTIDILESAVRFARLAEPFRRLEPDWPRRMLSELSTIERSLHQVKRLS